MHFQVYIQYCGCGPSLKNVQISWYTVAILHHTLLECPICLQLLCDPLTTPCGHSFCRPCLLSTLSKNIKNNVLPSFVPRHHSDQQQLPALKFLNFPRCITAKICHSAVLHRVPVAVHRLDIDHLALIQHASLLKIVNKTGVCFKAWGSHTLIWYKDTAVDQLALYSHFAKADYHLPDKSLTDLLDLIFHHAVQGEGEQKEVTQK